MNMMQCILGKYDNVWCALCVALDQQDHGCAHASTTYDIGAKGLARFIGMNTR